MILLAYQIGQDLNENENKPFLEKVVECLNINDIDLTQFKNLVKILNGSFTQEQHTKFLAQNNKSDY